MTSEPVQDGQVLFADLVAVSDRVKASSGRQDKIEELSFFLWARSSTEASLVAELLLRARLFDDPDPSDDDARQPRAHSPLTCEDVADAIAKIDRSPARVARLSSILRLLVRATSAERRWIENAVSNQRLDRRTFDLIVSSAASTAQVSAASIRRAATLSGSVPLAVRIAFEGGEAGLKSVAFEPGRPIPPTLAEEADAEDLPVDIPASALVEWNVNADRIQVHRVSGKVAVYDQQLNDVTDAVPTVVKQVTAFPQGDLVLDGWFDIGHAQAPDPPAVAGWTWRSRVGQVSEHALFFDILFDGAPVIDESLAVRRDLLASVVPERWRMPILAFADHDDVAASMNESIRLGHDGLIMKPLEAPYESGLVKSSWRKINPAHLVKLAVVAAERGRGRRAHLLSWVHLAARDDRGRFQDVGKTECGSSEEMIVSQTVAFADLELEGAHDESTRLVRLRPEIVAVVAIDGIDESDRHPAGLTLRQPRVIGYQQGMPLGVTTVQMLRDIAHHDRDANQTLGADAVADPEQHGEFDRRSALTPLPPAPPAAAEVDTNHDVPSSCQVDGESLAIPMGPSPQYGAASGRATTDVGFESNEESVMRSSNRPWRRIISARVAPLMWVVWWLPPTVVLLFAVVAIPIKPTEVGVVLLVATGWAWSHKLVRTLNRPGSSTVVRKEAPESNHVERSDTTVALDRGLDITTSNGQPAATPIVVPADFSGSPHDQPAGFDMSDEDPIVAMRLRIPRRPTIEHATSDIEAPIGRAGSQEIDADLAAHQNNEQGQQPTVHSVSPRLYAVRVTRLTMVTAFTAMTLVSAWLVSVALSSDTVAGTEELAPSVVAHLDLARRIFWGLLTTGFALMSVWSLVVMRQARRAGVTVMRARRVGVLVVIAVTACVCGFAFDSGDRGVLTLLLTIPITWSAVSAGFGVEQVRVWFELPGTTLTAWIATLPVILGVAVLADLSTSVQPTASLQRLAFTTILLALVCARVTVMSVLSSRDLEGELRVSSEVPVPTRDRGRS
jgi:DNA ligase-1